MIRIRIRIRSYGCSTAAGPGVDRLWNGLTAGQNFSAPVPTANWALPPDFTPVACRWPRAERSSAEDLLFHLNEAWEEARNGLPSQQLGRVGVLLASTKGLIEDFIWREPIAEQSDLISPLLESFCRHAEIHPSMKTVVSNACASSVSALWLASKWLSSDRVDTVIVLAADEAGAFALHGFHRLLALTASVPRPFSGDRDGLQLGDAAAVIILDRAGKGPTLTGAAIDVEGRAVTRPSPGSLKRVIKALGDRPDLIIAHGTGTLLNDSVEDEVFYGSFGRNTPITGSKWSIGHTLGASGAIDVILACECIRRGAVFRLETTAAQDPTLLGRYLFAGTEEITAPRSVLVSSLGFGGIHSAVKVEADQ